MKVLWMKLKSKIGHYTKNLGGNGFFDLSKMEKKSNPIKSNKITNKKEEVRQLAKVIQFPR